MCAKRLITPASKWPKINITELYRYRQLLLSFALKDIRVKYAQTLIGVTWAVINPILTIVLLTFVFQEIAEVSTQGVPPILHNLTGFAAWSYFASVFNGASSSIQASNQMIKKIYFPRLVLPLSQALSAIVELFVVSVIILALMVLYRIPLGVHNLFIPLMVLLLMVFGLAAGIWVSALTVRFRDFRFVTPFLLQAGLFLSPIAYPLSAVPEGYRIFYYLNPMAGIVEGFRWALLGVGDSQGALYFSVPATVIGFVLALYYFKKSEITMADIL